MSARARRNPLAVHYSSKKSTHRTPLELVDSIERHFGQIALDPCAYRPIERQTVLAARAWCAGGLRMAWDFDGLVYVNPPYGKSIGRWVLHALEQRKRGAEILLLVPARTDTAWFNTLLWIDGRPVPWCAVRGRLKFHRQKSHAPFPSALVYLGDRVDAFRAFAAEWGRCFVEVPIARRARRSLEAQSGSYARIASR